MPKQKTQIIYIHGGMTFKNKRGYLHFLKHREISIEEKMRWSGAYLKKKLGNNFQIIRPRMPLGDNAKYVSLKARESFLKGLGVRIEPEIEEAIDHMREYREKNQHPKENKIEKMKTIYGFLWDKINDIFSNQIDVNIYFVFPSISLSILPSRKKMASL